MAYFGLSHPWIAKLNVATGKYSGGFRCSSAVATSVTPAYNEGSLYADNREKESVNEFKNAAVTLEVDRMPAVAAGVVFGHKTNAEGEEISNGDDSGQYVGYGFITGEQCDGKKIYRACVLFKVKFSEGEESYDTRGDSIVFVKPKLNGKAVAIANNDWRVKSPEFDTEDEADLWIRKKLNVVETCETPTASVKGGAYADTQSVSLTTATSGAKIKYTTDGTTPGADNGTEYKTPISIAANTGLRAYAYKNGLEDSGIMVEEYYISAAKS